MAKKASSQAKAGDNVATETADARESPDKTAENAGGYGDLDKVRHILFGAQSQQFEMRFQQLEAYLRQEFGAVRESVARRFEALEARLAEEKAASGERFKTEQRHRTDAETKLGEEIQAVAGSLSENRTQLDEHIARMEDDFRAKLAEQAGAASRDLGQRFDALTERLEQAVAELRAAKTDRLDLAELFERLSEQLRKEP